MLAAVAVAEVLLAVDLQHKPEAAHAEQVVCLPFPAVVDPELKAEKAALSWVDEQQGLAVAAAVTDHPAERMVEKRLVLCIGRLHQPSPWDLQRHPSLCKHKCSAE